jgi:hypothetical protein
MEILIGLIIFFSLCIIFTEIHLVNERKAIEAKKNQSAALRG